MRGSRVAAITTCPAGSWRFTADTNAEDAADARGDAPEPAESGAAALSESTAAVCRARRAQRGGRAAGYLQRAGGIDWHNVERHAAGWAGRCPYPRRAAGPARAGRRLAANRLAAGPGADRRR